MAGESGVRGDAEHWIDARSQPRGRPLEAQPLCVLLRRLADDSAELAMKVKRRPAGLCRERVERHIAIQAVAQRLEELQDVALGWHDGEMLPVELLEA
jgi:hypothetical protein